MGAGNQDVVCSSLVDLMVHCSNVTTTEKTTYSSIQLYLSWITDLSRVDYYMSSMANQGGDTSREIVN